ncbi:MAG: hypothetical protein GTN40_02665 [Candidatus Aenigmarchaeota archaeon]|nr:hypothetical protein [Candidatus Aenigmarchaeota archaeon]
MPRKKIKREPTWDEIGEVIGRKMEKEFRGSKRRKKNFKCAVKDSVSSSGTGGWFYFLGFIAALIYYITTAPTFWDGVVGFFKAIFWPAFLVYGTMVTLGL